MNDEIKVIPLDPATRFGLYRQRRATDLFEERIPLLVAGIYRELEDLDNDFWDSVAQLAGFKSNFEVHCAGKKLVVNWMTNTIRVEPDDKQ